MNLSNTSNNKPFSKSEIEALDLWDIAEQFGKKPKVIVPVKKTAPVNLTVSDIEAMQKQAFDEAFLQGKAAGYEQGFSEAQPQGFAEGQKQGFKQGYTEGQDVIAQQSTEWVTLLESLATPFKLLDESVEHALLDLVIGITKQLVRREIQTHPDQIIAIIKEGLNALPIAARQLTLSLHPEDALLVRKSLDLKEMSLPWLIIEDPLLTRGGCHLEAESSRIDMTIETQMAIIVTTLLGGEREDDG